ncbi:MAG: 1,4-alpha-glucan branching protein GlgB [Armatimonadota bacterium]
MTHTDDPIYLTPPEQVAAVCGGYCSDPFAVLGMHIVDFGTGDEGNEMIWGIFPSLVPRPAPRVVTVRAFYPFAESVSVRALDSNEVVPMRKIHPDGFFEAVFWERTEPFPYRLIVSGAWNSGHETREFYDPYAFPLLLSDFDLHLIAEGNHFRLWQVLGAHIVELDAPSGLEGKVRGVRFAVWAPNALRVSVVGDFNCWDGRVHPMRFRHEAGVWELFLPEEVLGRTEGLLYKFEVKGRYGGYLQLKSDPVGFYHEVRPKSASILWDLSRYRWNDEDWISHRGEIQSLDKPISIYEVHLGSWRQVQENDGSWRWMTYRELAEQLVPYVKDMGFTHIELLPVMEHPLDESWGYQVTGYFAPTSRYGTPDDFKAFVNACHQAGIGVILDWVPAHFPKDMHGLVFFDGTNLYEYGDWRGDHPDWHTKVFNFGRNEIKNFLIASALFWLLEYHADGLRIDAVASMLYLDYSRKPGEWQPNIYGGNEHLEAIDFLKRLNEIVHQQVPGILMVAEESTAWPMVTRPTYVGGLGFDFKWNMGWMHDTLFYFGKDPIYRKYHHGALTFSLWYAFSENFILPLSHDEVVHEKASLLGKMPGDLWQKFANLRALFGYMWAHPGKKLLFMGGEIAQWREWDYASSIDWHLLQWESHRGIQRLVRDLNWLYRNEPALHEWDCDHRGFEWIDFSDADNSVVSFIRWARDWRDCIVVVCNFTPVVRRDYRIGVPLGGVWREVLNTDWQHYGGSNVGNSEVVAEALPWQNRPFSVRLTLPPLSVIFLKRVWENS